MPPLFNAILSVVAAAMRTNERPDHPTFGEAKRNSLSHVKQSRTCVPKIVGLMGHPGGNRGPESHS